MPRTPKPEPLVNRLVGYVGFPDREHGPFVLMAHWIERDGQTVPVGIEVWKDVHPIPGDASVQPLREGVKGLEATDLRRIPLATVLADLWEIQRESSSNAHAAIQERTPDHADVLEPQRFSGRYRRVSPGDVEHFRRVAQVYEEAMRAPGRKRPTMAVQDRFDVTASTAAKWVQRSRQLGLLPKTSTGRPSAAPQPKTSRRKAKR